MRSSRVQVLVTNELWATCSGRIDDIIPAGIPDGSADEDLFNIVTQQVIHESCASLNLSSPRMNEGKCAKRFPKRFTPFTVTETDRFILSQKIDRERWQERCIEGDKEFRN